MSVRFPLTLAVGNYDINRGLIDGTVQAQGMDLTVLVYPSPQRHWRMLLNREFDVCELSMGSYVTLRSRGETDLIAIPVFPHRRFRHGYVFGSAAAGVRSPEQLAGGAVGIRSWQTTAGVWGRGILEERHGVDLSSIRWVAQDADDVAVSLPADLVLERVAEGDAVTDLCAAGRLEGLIYPELPDQVKADDGTILRLFDDPKQAEQEYFRETGIFPIMHTVVIRAELLEDRPWIARNLFEAFQQSKQRAYAWLQDPRVVSLAWLRALIEEERELLGPDPWAYGIKANRTVLETFLRYAHRQGLATGDLDVEDLFHPSVLAEPPAYV